MKTNVPPDAAPPTNPAPDNELTKEYMVAISKEIETTMTGITSFRTKVGFGMFVGPFVLLSSLVVAAKGERVSFSPSKVVLPALGLFACYLGIAYIAAKIEEHAYEQCNKWRELIRDLRENPSLKITDSSLVKNPRAMEGYLYSFALLFLSVVAAVFIVQSAVEPTKPGGSAPTFRIEQVNP